MSAGLLRTITAATKGIVDLPADITAAVKAVARVEADPGPTGRHSDVPPSSVRACSVNGRDPSGPGSPTPACRCTAPAAGRTTGACRVSSRSRGQPARSPARTAVSSKAEPGSTTAPLSAFSSYSRGINGIMVDISGSHGAITADDFTFKMGTSTDVATWGNAPAPLSVTTRAGAGVGGSDRVTIVWANNAIQNAWLQVIVEGNDSLGSFNTNTNLAASDVFFFGNKAGDTFISSQPTVVQTNINDSLAVRGNPAFLQPISNVYDFNRDQVVNINDELVSRFNSGFLTRNLTWSPVGDPMAAAEDSGAAVASALACRIGLCSGRIVTHEFSRMRFVAPASAACAVVECSQNEPVCRSSGGIARCSGMAIIS